MKPIFKRFLSGVLSAAMTVSAIPIVSSHAAEGGESYPYTMFAASNDEGAITINAGNFCVNGNVATNGTIVSSGNMNINGTKTESADESMIYIFDKIDTQFFSASNVEEHDDDYSLDEINININVPTEVQGEATLTGNININNALKALEDVNLYGDVKNTNDSVIFSKYGDIVIDSQNVNLNGLVYAPFGCVKINAQNLNLNNVVIIAESIEFTCPNVNANNSSHASSFVGTTSEPLDVPYNEWQYLKDENSNGIPDCLETDSDEEPGQIDYVDPLEAEYELSSDTSSLLIGTDSLNATFYVETIASPESIVLYEGSNIIGQMYDDGNYLLHGDDIMGDGVYSLKYSFTNIPNKTESRYFCAKINDSVDSNEVAISLVVPFTQEEIDNMTYVNDLIKDLLDSDKLPEEISHISIEEATNSIIPDSLLSFFNSKVNKLLDALQTLLDEGKIKSFEYDEQYKCIRYEFDNGIPIIIAPDDILDLYIDRDKDMRMIIDDPDAPTTKYQGYDMVLFNAFESDRDDYYNDLIERLEKNSLEVKYFDDVKISTLKYNLKGHDIIVLSGHGSYLTGNIPTFDLIDYIATSELDSIYQDDINNNRIIHRGSGFYSITPEFVNFYFGSKDLDNSYVFSESCQFYGRTDSGINYDFADSFTSASAEAVVGFENPVNSVYSREFMEYYNDKLLTGSTAQEAFDAAKDYLGDDDTDYKTTERDSAIPILRGDANAQLVKTIKNGDFERKPASGTSVPMFWKGEGDVRAVSRLGKLAPYGKKMAFLSTGIGAKSATNMSGTQGSYLSQTIYNTDSSKLEFKYKMISEEPMEFVGRSYDDTFEVQILDLSGNVIFSKILESVNRSTWYSVSDINFDGGDSTVFQTTWNTGSIDISDYKNQSITIRFLVYDVGDSAYDSAVLIDNVVCK